VPISTKPAAGSAGNGGPAVTAARSFAPDGIETEAGRWQSRKSAQTRVAILTAAIDCLRTLGYARTTTQMIAEKAGVSRGAMLHHYATKADLVEGVIDYIFFARMTQFERDIGSLSEAERVDEIRGLELLWQSMQGPEYGAQLELAVAARSDEELKAVYEPKSIRFNAMWRKGIHASFPEWGARTDMLLLSVDFAQATLDGLLLNKPIWPERERRVAVRRLLAAVVHAMQAGKLAADGG
jgi:AcrR family transcriptional regulator